MRLSIIKRNVYSKAIIIYTITIRIVTKIHVEGWMNEFMQYLS